MNNKSTCIQWSWDKGTGILDADNREKENNMLAAVGLRAVTMA